MLEFRYIRASRQPRRMSALFCVTAAPSPLAAGVYSGSFVSRLRILSQTPLRIANLHPHPHTHTRPHTHLHPMHFYTECKFTIGCGIDLVTKLEIVLLLVIDRRNMSLRRKCIKIILVIKQRKLHFINKAKHFIFNNKKAL